MMTSISSVARSYATESVAQSQSIESRIPAAVRKTLDMNDTLELSDGTKVSREEAPRPKRELTEEDKKLREVLHQFVGQTLFGQMLKQVRESQQKDPYFHGGNAEEIFQSQLDQVYIEKMSNTTGRSLSDAMFNQMQRMMGKAEI